MGIDKLARELDETARQTAAMVGGITEAIELLSSRDVPHETARSEAVAMIVRALQGQDRIEQRCRNLAQAVRHMALLPAGATPAEHEAVWSRLTLDELRVPALSGIAAHVGHGEAELF